MSAAQKNLDRLQWLFICTLLLFVVFTATFALYVFTEWRLDQANERRYQSYLLADELRQSSDDLTRMVRSYVATGNPKYRQYFFEIIAIRDGTAPRPLHYNQIYWDLVYPRHDRPKPAGEKASLISLMQAAHFSSQEFARLADAKRQSDRLIRIELAAMDMVARSDALPPGQAGLLRAQALLKVNDENYMQHKARIMRPIDEFYQLIEQRTLFEVQQAAMQARLVRFVFLLVTAGLCLLLLRMRTYSRDVLGGSLRQLYRYIVHIGDAQQQPAPAAEDDTILAWLTRTDTRLRDLAQQQSLVRQQLASQAHTDALTGLANRRALIASLQAWVQQPPSQPWALAYLDLDGFKPVNDDFGHAAGDALLQRIARQLQQWPAAQCAARMGGDEFVLLLVGEHDYTWAMQQLAAQLGKVQQLEGYAVQVSVSIGLACFTPGAAPGVDEVLRQADKAMYQAKAAGKRTVCVYRPAASA